MNQYTIKDFNKQFSDDGSCLAYIFEKRYGKEYICPLCGKTGFYRIKARKCYSCAWCGFQLHPVAGTIFHKSDTPLKLWFFAIFLMSQSKNGVSAMELQRHLGVTYKTAWRIAKQIRTLFTQKRTKLSGIIETDETYVGGKGRNNNRGRGAENKTAVFGLAQRKGKVIGQVVENVKSSTVMPLVRRNIKLGSSLMTDEFPIYNRIASQGYNHQMVNHGNKQCVIGNAHTNTIEGFWSQLKRSIDGTYHAVSPKYLQTYLNQFSYQYNHRGVATFPLLLKAIVSLGSKV